MLLTETLMLSRVWLIWTHAPVTRCWLMLLMLTIANVKARVCLRLIQVNDWCWLLIDWFMLVLIGFQTRVRFHASPVSRCWLMLLMFANVTRLMWCRCWLMFVLQVSNVWGVDALSISVPPYEESMLAYVTILMWQTTLANGLCC